VGQVLAEYLNGKDWHRVDEEFSEGNGGNGHQAIHAPEPPQSAVTHKIGDLCPECGEAAVVNEEGCRKCYACGYSEC
jgi:ribonucleoside-diphosphate reductase alpha chain